MCLLIMHVLLEGRVELARVLLNTSKVFRAVHHIAAFRSLGHSALRLRRHISCLIPRHTWATLDRLRQQPWYRTWLRLL